MKQYTHYKEFIKFCVVGASAALTHYAVLMFILHFSSMPLALGNLIAFVVAFWVSYFGHRIFTFNVQNIQHQQALPKFMMVAVFGFIFNEVFLLSTHHLFPMIHLSILIILTIGITAIFTFFLSKFFAFKISGSSV